MFRTMILHSLVQEGYKPLILIPIMPLTEFNGTYYTQHPRCFKLTRQAHVRVSRRSNIQLFYTSFVDPTSTTMTLQQSLILLQSQTTCITTNLSKTRSPYLWNSFFRTSFRHYSSSSYLWILWSSAFTFIRTYSLRLPSCICCSL